MSDPKNDDVKCDHLENTSRDTAQGQSREITVESEVVSYHDSYKPSTRTYLVLIAMGFTWGTCTIGNIGPSTTSAGAAASLGGSSVSSWIPNAALFPIIGLQPMWGSLADRFGKKWFIAAGGIFGVVGNIVAGTAKTKEAVIGGQAVNGIGSSLFLLVVPAGMEIVSAAHRSFAQGLMGSINGTISIMVLLVSGSFAQMSTYGWRWVYYFNAIFFGVCALSIVALYNPPPTTLRRENNTKDIVKSIDLPGIALFLCGIIPVVIGLTWGGRTYPWDSARVIALLTVGAVLLVFFGFYEAYGRKNGLLDHQFFQKRNFPVVIAVAFVDGLLLYGVNTFLPQEVGGLFTHDKVKIAVYLLPLNLCVILGIASSSYILGVFRHYRTMLMSSMAVISLFSGLLALVDSDRLAMLLVFTGITGFGVGVTTTLPNIILTYSVPSHLIGTAGTLLASCRALGGVVGITIFVTINGNYMTSHRIPDLSQSVLEAGLPPSSVPDFVTAFIAGDISLESIYGTTPAIITAANHALEDITAESFKWVWIANAIVGVVATVLTCFLHSVDEMMTSHVETPLENSQLRQSVMTK